MNSARIHADLAHSDATPTESMVGLPPFDACDPRHDTTVVIWPGRDSDGQPRVLSRQAEDVAYMSPELLATKLRAIYKEPHYCRSVGCENVVDHCGDNCPRCTSEIDALLLLYAEQQDPRITWSTVLISCGIGAAVFGVVTLVLKWAGVL